jgi:glutaredoxin
MNTLILYTITGCSKCQLVKNFLRKRQQLFTEVNVMEQPERYQEVVNFVGEFYAPVLVNGKKAVKCENISKLEEII